MIVRKEIRSLSPDELLALRRAMIIFQQRNDVDSYIAIAGYHGIPKWFCPHGSVLFLPWHRMYIFKFEEELRKIDASVTIPFWNWTSPESLRYGIAAAHNDKEFEDGGSKLNPLRSGPIEDRSRNTDRGKNPDIRKLTKYSENVDKAFATSTNYTEFNSAIAGPHGDIHTWIAGDMGRAQRAAYDPIFWSHHANVDRQWAIWQIMHPDEVLPLTIQQLSLCGFHDKRVGHVLNYERELNYTYEDLHSKQELESIIKRLNKISENINTGIVVEINGIDSSGVSLSVDLFVKNKNAEEIWGGSFGIFGMGMQHHAGHDHSHGHRDHFLKQTRFIDITEAVEHLKASTETIQINLRGMTLDGEEVKEKDLPIDQIKIRRL